MPGMLATEPARNPLDRSNTASAFQSRANMNGGSSSMVPSSRGPQSNRYTSGSKRLDISSDRQGLFPSPISPPPSNGQPQATQNIMNKTAGANSSLYQICLNLRKRLSEVPGFHVHIEEMEEEEAETNDSTDPVTSMWNCLRRGFPLMTVYNALQPRVLLEVDHAKYPEAKIGKAATFKFLQACLTELKFASNECFLITDLYGEDTTGFVKVTKVVNRVLDILQKEGLLRRRRPSTTDTDSSQPHTSTTRQKIIEEIVQTERNYVNHLEDLQRFKKEIEESGAIAGDAVHDIFLNLNNLLDFQRRFLIRIEQQNSLPEMQQNWGKLFFHYKESFRVYEPFISNQNRCNDAVSKEWDKIRVASISSGLHDMTESQSTLMGFLLKPFQRLSRYPMLLETLEKKGGLDDDRKKDLNDGRAATMAILARANHAVDKEHRLAAVNELRGRVEDWKGHKIEHFGMLLLFGNYTVLKGEGVKEVEREVSIIFDYLDPKSKALLRHAVRATQRSRRLPPSSSKRGPPLSPSPTVFRAQRKFSSELPQVPEDPLQACEPLAPKDTPRKRFGSILFARTTISPSPPSTPGSEPPTPSRSGKLRAGIAQLKSLLKSPETHKKPRPPPITPKAAMECAKYPFMDHYLLKRALTHAGHLLRFNGPFTRGTALLFSSAPRPSIIGSDMSPDQSPFVTLFKKKAPALVPIAPLEKQLTDELALKLPRRMQYKVFLFERILLCCKEINPNKPKNKMLGTSKALVDRKGKPKLQLKGRIFMQNVTDVVTLTKADKSSYTIQIFWKGDPGVENFVIRFTNEETMIKWRDTVQAQKKSLCESARISGQAGTSATEFTYLKNQPSGENPYREDDEIEDEGTLVGHTSTRGQSSFAESRNASNTSLRSAAGQHSRIGPPKFPTSEHGSGPFAPALSLNTNIPPGTASPGEFAGQSYFSPTAESPASTRSSTQASMYGFHRQQTPTTGWSHENNKHRTAPDMGRAPSREGPGPPNSYILNGRTVMRPSLPAMAASQHPQQQMAMAQSRIRSASTPNIHDPNAPGAGRAVNGQLQPPIENVPVPPLPANVTHMRVPVVRSRTTSPIDHQLPVRSATRSPSMQRDMAARQQQDQIRYDHHGRRMPLAHQIEIPKHKQGDVYSDAFIINTPASSFMSDEEIQYPNQLKVKIYNTARSSHVTIVVPTAIKHQTLIDRIDSKMAKISSAAISKGTARLRYKDQDEDLITIESDDDVGIAVEDWGTKNAENLRENAVPDDFELYWVEV